MYIPAIYMAVILIWSTTPLAIQWSGEGGGYLFGVTARMVAGAVFCLLLLLVARVSLPLHAAALRAYVAAGMGIFGAMLCVYWGSQFIPSGWISVLFGLTPIFTGAFALLLLGEEGFTPAKGLGLLLGLAGLVVIFGNSRHSGAHALWGVLAVLASVILHSMSAVLVKRVGADLSAMAVTSGGLLMAAPAYLLCWWLLDGQWPAQLSSRAIASITYLALCGSVLGFMFFYYLLRHMAAGKVALITLVTPVLALMLGALLNGEVLSWQVLTGTLLILSGLASHQWGGRMGRVWAVIRTRLRKSPPDNEAGR